MHDQQQLMSLMYRATTKHILQQKFNNGMVIIGKVGGSVDLSDIGRVLSYGATAHITEYEINKSKKLQEAIRKGWVEIIEDRGAIKRAIVSVKGDIPQEVTAQGMNKDEMMSMAREIAKTMAAEMLKSNQFVVDAVKIMAEDMAKKMTNVQVTTVTPQEETKQKLQIDDVKPDDVFIDVDESMVKPQIGDIGTMKEEKTDISGQLEKMKRFKRRKESTE